MARGRKVEKRPADVNAGAVMAKIATGEIKDLVATPNSEGKNPAAVELGRMGGKARAAALGNASAPKSRERPRKVDGKPSFLVVTTSFFTSNEVEKGVVNYGGDLCPRSFSPPRPRFIVP